LVAGGACGLGVPVFEGVKALVAAMVASRTGTSGAQ
jgi:hypothetical protein